MRKPAWMGSGVMITCPTLVLPISSNRGTNFTFCATSVPCCPDGLSHSLLTFRETEDNISGSRRSKQNHVSFSRTTLVHSHRLTPCCTNWLLLTHIQTKRLCYLVACVFLKLHFFIASVWTCVSVHAYRQKCLFSLHDALCLCWLRVWCNESCFMIAQPWPGSLWISVMELSCDSLKRRGFHMRRENEWLLEWLLTLLMSLSPSEKNVINMVAVLHNWLNRELQKNKEGGSLPFLIFRIISLLCIHHRPVHVKPVSLSQSVFFLSARPLSRQYVLQPALSCSSGCQTEAQLETPEWRVSKRRSGKVNTCRD